MAIIDSQVHSYEANTSKRPWHSVPNPAGAGACRSLAEGKPVKGDKAIGYDWDEARYLFANAKNKATFASAPDKYAPRFGGLRATGLAFGQKVESDPQAWKIVDGQLYLFSSIKAREVADKDPTVLTRAGAGVHEKKK
jgi:YHS domain-containing protein